MRSKKELEFMGKYKLSADSMNIILQEKMHNKKKDIDYWANIAYFSNPQNALNYVIQKEIKESWVEDLKLVCQKIDKLEKLIQGLSIDLSREVVRAKSEGLEG